MFKVMRESNMDMDTAVYNIIIHGMCKAGKLEEAWNLFTNLLLSGLQPDVKTYNMMIRFSALGRAEKLYAEMLRRGIVPDTITYNSMIHGLCKQNKLAEARKVFDSMDNKSCSTFNTLINGYCKARRVDDGIDLFCEMYRRGIVANVITYTTLIHGFRQVGDFKTALDIFQEMVSNGVRSSSITFRDILPELCSKKELRKAVAMLVDLQKSVVVCPQRM
ncbi:pentatricopeptide repeat-containing protein [Arabidopsis lyrata subsp. lyrata]|uniref:Pentatricopeptide repeat-containing protein n=2 Tax=Arabidopsis lyrata subsp. lyrata TaxID=81972 RepID=D7L6S0_ARALL|nr:pentatricopeptide repeat-containing protein [Arabidopsis lyrata subsp. lyrata]